MESVSWIIRGAAVYLLLQAAASPQVQTPIFRPHITVVPLDIRVVDKAGHLVDDLRESDFQVFEDGKRQDIAFFSHELALNTPSNTASSIKSPSDVAQVVPTAARTFLLVLGRGRLESSSKALTSAIDFVRRQLAPEDRVGVAAYDRISDLTTDHEAVARLLVRYRDQHERIENALANYLRGLVLLHWDGVSLLPSIQAMIDRVFQAEGLPRLRSLPMLYGPDDEVFGDFRNEIADLFEHPVTGSAEVARGYQDLRHLLVCTEFLRPISGEKQLVFLTEQPPNNRKLWLMVDKLARLASDARIALSTIQTGGVPANFVRADPEALADVIAPPIVRGQDSFPGRTFDETFAIEAVRAAAKETGGVFSAYQPPVNAFRRIAEITSSRYLLGYYPPDSQSNGIFHNIEVKLTRGDVEFSYRHGYFATDTDTLKDPRAGLSRQRVNAAYEDYRSLADIPIEFSAHAVGNRVDISLRIDPKAIQFDDHERRKTATLEIGVLVGQSGRDSRRHKEDAVDLSFDAATFQRLTREKITYTTSIDVTGDPRKLEVKVVVYDYSADRVGTAVDKIR